jgi:adenine-specific DNA-methyltransferase
MSQNLEKPKFLLAELFQLGRTELDFGIYRYEGEGVKLYCANYDQYYIKTSEYFRDSTFKLPNGKRVHIKLVEADTEKDNNRPQNSKERRFIFSEKQPLAEENGGLIIRFEYRPDPEIRKSEVV